MSHQEHTHRKKIKVVVYVPESHTEAVRNAIGDAGAGVIGNYSHCMFTTKGVGQFKPLPGSNPTEGTIGEISEVIEDKIETVCMKDNLESVLSAIEDIHPYEEPAIDIYPIEEIDQK